ncbi:MAG TPA: histidinol-phosphate transaminase [Verrucomicrobiae bacterium]|nr:histidinol-phosphate transaminase [Verrucomicrobiae bacterium]
MRCASPQQCSILLDHNENAYGPSEKVLAVLRDAANFCNRYPRTEYDFLLGKIAAFHGVKPEQIALGSGSSEILRLVATEFLAPGKKLVQAAPTCPLLGRFARSVGVEVINVPVTRTYEHDLEAMLARAGDSTGLVHICNPNNPTGTLTRRKDIETFVQRLPANTMVLVDEAYHDFVGPNGSYASFLEQPIDDPRVMVTRTFSKMYGLAGMRVGYIVAAPEVARRISAHQLHFGISVISARASAAALDDPEYARQAAKRNADDRQEFLNQVNARFLHALDSHANFFMLDPMRPMDQVMDHFKKNRILIGPLITEMPKYVRVSLGNPPEMEEFWRVLDLMPGSGKMVM